MTPDDKLTALEARRRSLELLRVVGVLVFAIAVYWVTIGRFVSV